MLIVAAVTVGVSAQVFVSSLIGGLQADLVARTVGAQPHVVLEPAEQRVRRARPIRPSDVVLATVERRVDRSHGIESWSRIVARLARVPGVRAVAPKVTGPGLVLRAESSESAVVIGTPLDAFDL